MRLETIVARRHLPHLFDSSAFLLEKLIDELSVGTLEVILPNGRHLLFSGRNRPEISAQLRIDKPRALRRLVTGGAVGFAEGYLEGDWSTSSLPDLLRLAAFNDEALASRTQGLSLQRLIHRLQHLANSNSRERARRNISYHYDLGNDFYSAWLDESMTYSAALFTSPDMSLTAAQRAKLDRLADMADISGSVGVLEIGCGWGSFLERVAERTHGHLTGVSISERQSEFARQRLAARNIRNVSVELCDYRDVAGSFDRIVSVEMFEAVGEKYWPTYAQTIKRLLRQDGKAALQVITIDESRFDQYRKSADFIQRYIFPGGMLPSKRKLNEVFEDADMRVTDTLSFGRDYATTLALWRERFHAAWPALRELGFDERFKRMWDYYFAYCEGGFSAGSIDVVQIRVEHP